MVLTVLHPRPGDHSGQQESLKVEQVLVLPHKATHFANSRRSIVAVHGLNGDAVKTWTNKKTGAFWLQDYLPADIEDARVMNYAYNADVAFGNTVADIMDFAKDLLNSLIDKREREEVSRRS